MTGTMRAQRFYKDTGKWAVEDVPIPEPGPGQVLIKVAYCGICHSDLSLIDGVFGGLGTPEVITQGHEASGTIAALGEGVTGWSIDDGADGRALYDKLENVVLPLYYENPTQWIWMMKQAISKIACYFNSHRMMRRYAAEAYLR